jgi:RimJ/RimL family protein N-acetyltransferase
VIPPPGMLAALAHERQATMLARAESDRRARRARLAARRARQRTAATMAPSRRPAEAVPAQAVSVVLRDGSRVTIRPVLKADAPLLADGFTRLSARSRWMRFLHAKSQLTEAELRYLTDVDHHDHEAIGAVDRDGRGVGVARFVRDREDGQAADVAVTVVDEWQRRGLGTELLSRLSDRARQEGISRFTGVISAYNAPMAGLLEHLRAEPVSRELDTVSYEVALGRRSGHRQQPTGG